MQKTTIYLGQQELHALKRLAARSPSATVASLLREALREYLQRRRSSTRGRFLRKLLRRRPSRSTFGDGVAYQRRLRAEWD